MQKSNCCKPLAKKASNYVLLLPDQLSARQGFPWKCWSQCKPAYPKPQLSQPEAVGPCPIGSVRERSAPHWLHWNAVSILSSASLSPCHLLPWRPAAREASGIPKLYLQGQAASVRRVWEAWRGDSRGGNRAALNSWFYEEESASQQPVRGTPVMRPHLNLKMRPIPWALRTGSGEDDGITWRIQEADVEEIPGRSRLCLRSAVQTSGKLREVGRFTLTEHS